MPPIRAACARFIPSSTPANDKSRRLWFAFLVAPASRRSSPAEKSLRTLTAAGMARILPAPWNQLSPKYGIPVSHKRWPLVLAVQPAKTEVGIRSKQLALEKADCGEWFNLIRESLGKDAMRFLNEQTDGANPRT